MKEYKKHDFFPLRNNNSISLFNNSINARCKYCNVTIDNLIENTYLLNKLSPFMEEIRKASNYDLFWKIINETIPCLTEEECMIKELLE